MKTNKVKIKRFVLTNIPYFIVSYAGNLMCFAFRTAEGETVSDKIIPAIENLGPTLAHILPSMNPYDILIGAAAGGVTKAVMKIREADRKKFRHGTEYGSAVWGSSKDIEPYMDTGNIENNIILTMSEYLTMGRPSLPIRNMQEIKIFLLSVVPAQVRRDLLLSRTLCRCTAHML